MGEKMTAADVAELAYWRRIADWDRKSQIDNSSHRERVEKVRVRALADEPLTQPAQAVDVGAIREVIAELSNPSMLHAPYVTRCADKLTAALPNANGKDTPDAAR